MKDLYDTLASNSRPLITPDSYVTVTSIDDMSKSYTNIGTGLDYDPYKTYPYYSIYTNDTKLKIDYMTEEMQKRFYEQLKPVKNNKEINNKMSVRKETKTAITPKTNYYQLDYYKDSKISGWKLIPKISEIKQYNGNTVKIKFADDSFETAVLSADDEEARLEAALAICYLKKMLDCGGKGEYGTNAFNKLLNIMLKQIEKQKKFDEEKLAKEAEVKRIRENRKAKKEKRLAKQKIKKILNE